MLIDDFLSQSAECWPGKTAVVCAGERWSYRRIEEASNRFARALVAEGFEPGARVDICLENSIETIVSLFGVLKAGGAFVIVNPQSRTDHVRFLLRDSGASILIAGRRHTDVATAAGTRVLPFGSALASAEGASDLPRLPRSETDLAALVYTSGSTGESKGVMLTHRNMTAAATAIGGYLDNTADDVILSALPLAFTYGLGQVTTAFRAGATLVLERSFLYPRAIIETMRREKVTGFPLVPTMATLLLRQDLKPDWFGPLRYITNAAAALPRPRMQRLRETFPSAKIYSMYGLTECQRASYLPPEEIDRRPDSVGVPIPGTTARVVDDKGRRVPPGVVGELVVAGAHVMAGYWNRPEATRGALRPDALSGETVLYTGDLFRTDVEGFLYFVERKDDVIKTGGEKVAPRHVEAVIAQLDDVAEVAVFGVPDDVLGEAVAAVIASVDGAILTAESVRRHCLRHLEPFMVPKAVEIRKALPTTLTGKISRRMLRAEKAGTAA